MRADRLISILLLLQNRGRMTARELSQELEVSERTIYRDVEALCAAGVPVTSELGPGGGFGLPHAYRTSLTGLTEPEVRTLFVAGVPRLLADLGLDGALDAALLKLAANLPATQRNDAERISRRMYLDPSGWFQALDAVPQLPAVQQAVWHDRKLELVYRKAGGEVVERLVDPYGLVAKAGVWYLVGASRGQIRVFRVGRIRAATVTAEPADRPAGFDVERFWIGWCSWFEQSRQYYSVAFRASPAAIRQLPFAVGDWVCEQLERPGSEDAEGWTSLTMVFGSPEQALAVMLGLGAAVEVLEPAELRAALIETAREALAFYARRASSD